MERGRGGFRGRRAGGFRGFRGRPNFNHRGRGFPPRGNFHPRGGFIDRGGFHDRGGYFRGGFPDFRSNFRGNFQNQNRGQYPAAIRGYRGISNYERNRYPLKKDNTKRLQETDIGITEFINPNDGFKAIIKARYSDFQVNEIDLDGNITKLTNTDIPAPTLTDTVEDESSMGNFNTEFLPEDTWQEIASLLSGKGNGQPVKFDVTDLTKEQRTIIHSEVKGMFGKAIVSSTVAENEKKFVQFTLYDKDAKQDRREKWLFSGEYLYFLVHKEKMDTMHAATVIGNALKMRPRYIGYAGTKDRRAKTTQWFCIRKVRPERLMSVTSGMKNLLVGNICFKDHPLKLGQLKGNRFRVALRNVQAEDDLITKAVTSLKENGFINYYGLQRFGSSVQVPTHFIGRALLKGQWKEAVDLILKPRNNDTNIEMHTARCIWQETRNAFNALRSLPKAITTIESFLLRGLVEHSKNDYLNALENVPRNMRLLYLHAFQSYVWNAVVSRRIKEWGLSPHVGDLILLKDEYDENVELGFSVEDATVDGQLDISRTESEIETVDVKPDVKSDNGSSTKEPDETCETASKDKTEEEQPVKTPVVKVLTEQDIQDGNYSMYDIVMPLPGHDVVYPSNEALDWYLEVLTKNDMNFDSFKQKVKTYCLSGAYRKVLARPSDLSWYTMRYTDPNSNLILSDVEEMRNEATPASVEDGKFKALILDFCLSSSTYATMALREILKSDTSVEHQSKLNNYFEKPKPKEETGNDNLQENVKEESETTEDVEESNNDGDMENTSDECSLQKHAEKRKTDGQDEDVVLKKIKSDNE